MRSGVSETLKAVGYWRESGARHWPRPQWLVRKDWQNDDRQRIIAYLRSGHEIAAYVGHSFCRFDCGIDDFEMGNRDLTDGEWIWPEGLAHYIESHSVILPEQLIDTMRLHAWQVSDLDRVAKLDDAATDAAKIDFKFWEKWTRQHQKRPWYAYWS
jgi:hypothetical protein